MYIVLNKQQPLQGLDPAHKDIEGEHIKNFSLIGKHNKINSNWNGHKYFNSAVFLYKSCGQFEHVHYHPLSELWKCGARLLIKTAQVTRFTVDCR